MTIKLWTCKSCGHSAMPCDSHKFCSHCGSSQETPENKFYSSSSAARKLLGEDFFTDSINCMSCQANLLSFYVYCTSCGVKVDEAAVSPDNKTDSIEFSGDSHEFKKAEESPIQNVKAPQQFSLGMIGHQVESSKNPYIIPRKSKLVRRIKVAAIAASFLAALALTMSSQYPDTLVLLPKLVSGEAQPKLHAKSRKGINCSQVVKKYRGKKLSKKGRRIYNHCVARLDI